MLEVKEVTTEYSGMKALHGVSMTLREDEFVSIVGPNGAGKSTLLKTISGTAKVSSGEIYFTGTDITHMKAYKRTGLGIIHIPEGRRVFPSLTVLENLEIGAYRPEARDSVDKNLETVLNIFPVLKKRSKQPAGTLSGGEQQMLAIGRGLMSMPRFLMLDEPSLGLSPVMADLIFETIMNIRQRLKFSILLVEQRAVEALEFCDRAYILESGKITMSGDRATLVGNPMIQKAYLGTM
ncbi:MAG: High-affinity branched-chain amino acid transport ATP-binding protein LivF [Syntrophorhabdus sp. PtaU1.Bin058]|nr:MAG: High-affinity branched-chain amino acid transport ATP-binding protein LivF [Syntrophorhabdus sp. PtaU1.Bin058]